MNENSNAVTWILYTDKSFCLPMAALNSVSDIDVEI